MLDPDKPNEPIELIFAGDVRQGVYMEGEIFTHASKNLIAVVRFNSKTGVHDLYLAFEKDDFVKVNAEDFARLLRKAIDGIPEDYIRRQESLDERTENWDL